MSQNNYYVSSFFWSTLAKVLNAILSFITIPILLGLYGKAQYGILSIATACNAYMHVLDLGINTGVVKFFSQWRVEGRQDLINNVARTNITFYIIISFINSLGLLTLAIWGETFFAVTHEQFVQLRICLCILALFSIFNWVSTAFNQLLVADKQIGFTMKIQCLQIMLKAILVFIVLYFHLSLTIYFFFLTMIVALLVVPYAIRSRRCALIDSLLPKMCWNDFRIVLIFSLSIFALSIIQVTATQSRPILLSIFATCGAESVADFRIIEVIPTFIIMIGGTFSSIFLPKASEMVTMKNSKAISEFAYGWTLKTSILANILCIPFILSAHEVLSAYVGEQFSYLSSWLIIWLLTVLLQIHTTPCHSLFLAYGKTSPMLISSGIACIISILINILLAKQLGVGSAVIGYFVYVIIVIGLYYCVYYHHLLKLQRFKMLKCFFKPTLMAFILFFVIWNIPIPQHFVDYNNRLDWILICIAKSLLWLIPYIVLLLLTHTLSYKELIGIMKIRK